ncbi:MAG: 7-cyano-7-deazaguanine synthase QueC [Candidatus Sabulitectum sp.]|nr:7-cyano-7-deazaguanine synthase QueC [Candidatus Sabulitectum sp.]
MSGNRAVVLLSGGLDSTTILAIASAAQMEVTALSFSYGQKHTQEIKRAEIIAEYFKVKEHLIIDLDPEPFKGSALTGSNPIPENRDHINKHIPDTYVPARNTIFLSIALGIAETRKADHIFIGVNSLDYSGYPDCRPEYIEAFQKLTNLATRTAVNGNPPAIEAPLLHMTKAEIIRKGIQLGVDYGMTLSCYQPNTKGESCGVCDACSLRLAGFKANNLTDPASYRKESDVR